MDVIYTSSAEGGETKSRAEGMKRFFWLDCIHEGCRETGGPQRKKVTDKGALSKHSCPTCVHICVFVYTHTQAVCYLCPYGGFVAEDLINPQPPSHSPERQHLSAHIISQIPERH